MLESATVLRVDRKRVIVDLADGTVLEAQSRGRLHQARGRTKSPVAVGDQVQIERVADGGVAIVGVSPRRSVLKRPEAGGRWRDQVLVANADHAVLVFAFADPEPHAGLVDRLLVACHAGNVPPILVFNKSDLTATPETHALVDLYTGLGYRVLRTCASDGTGVDALKELLQGRSSLFAGPSGTGKSSLINVVLPGIELRTGEISRKSSKGQHTTTAAELVRLDGGAYVIDTPGIREFGLRDIPLRELELNFPEFPVPAQCRFLDCAHLTEPNCAVLQAVKVGEVARSRHASYRTLRSELDKSRKSY